MTKLIVNTLPMGGTEVRTYRFRWMARFMAWWLSTPTHSADGTPHRWCRITDS